MAMQAVYMIFRGKIMATRILANREVIVAKLPQHPINRQMDLHIHTAPRPLTNTAHLHSTLPLRVSIVHHPSHLRRDSMVPRRMPQADRIPLTEAEDPHPTTDIAQLHTNIVSNLTLYRSRPVYQIV